MTAEFFAALGMREVILERHSERSPPATNDKNNKREPIDGIWVTQDLQVNGAGYLPFGDGCKSDHCLLWADFLFHSAFGQDCIKPPRIPIKKLKADDPRLVKCYNRKVKAALTKEGLIKKAFALQETASKGLSSILQQDYNDIQTRNVKIRKDIEAKLRKLRMGGVEWSPKLQKF
jgi:hypothetical protein